ncbi:hypothetical protein AVEN_114401-1, partial [Araneus ventricosus]
MNLLRRKCFSIFTIATLVLLLAPNAFAKSIVAEVANLPSAAAGAAARAL